MGARFVLQTFGAARLWVAGLSTAKLGTIFTVLAIGALVVSEKTSSHPLADKTRLADKIAPGDIAIALEPIADGLAAPNWATAAPGRCFRSDRTTCTK